MKLLVRQKVVLILAFMGFYFNSSAQVLNKAEYFFDSDPGVGMATPVTVSSPSDTVDINVDIPFTSLPAGFHALGFRFRNANNLWGLTESRSFYVVEKTKSAPIVSAEYFFDTIPAIGSGKQISGVSKSDTLILNSEIPVTGLGAGTHTLYVFVKDSLGRYSLYSQRKFTVCELLPVADFISEFNPADTTVTFTNKTTNYDAATKFKWDVYNDKAVEDSTVDLVYKFKSFGTYDVKLISTATAACADTIIKRIIVNTDTCGIAAKFSSTVRLTKEVLFLNQSAGDYGVCYWNFGDGTTSTAKNPTHQYSSAGFYLVSLSIKNLRSNCTDFYSDIVQVGESACRALFTSVVNNSTKEVVFTNASKGSATRYFWYFGDGKYSTLPNPSNTYEKDGIYKVTLTISSADGACNDNYSALIQVGTIKCNAQYTYFVDSALRVATFNSKVQSITTNMFWAFGDGQSSELRNPKHVYKRNGNYVVGLTAYDPVTSCVDYFEQKIQVGNETNTCDADFSYLSSVTSDSVRFFDTSKGDIIGYLWNFGDESPTVSEKNPVHQFKDVGYYNVCHTAVSAKGLVDMACKQVMVKPGSAKNCRAQFYFNVDSANRKASISDVSEGKPANWEWTLNNKPLAAVQKPALLVTSAGYYAVGLKVTNPTTNCTNRTVKVLNIGQKGKLKAGFGFAVKPRITKAGGYPVDLVGAGLGDQSKLRWSFGDNTSDTTTTTPTYTYENAGTYKVCYEIQDLNGTEKDSVCQYITVSETGVEGFAISKSSSLELYPNPVADFVNISYQLTNSAIVEISITDVEGRIIETIVKARKASGEHTFTFDATNLKQGIYLVRYRADSETITKAIVKR